MWTSPSFIEEVFTSTNNMARVYKVKDGSEESRLTIVKPRCIASTDDVLKQMRNFGDRAHEN